MLQIKKTLEGLGMLERLKSLRWKAFGFALLFAVPLFTGAFIATTHTYDGAVQNNPFGWVLFLLCLASTAYFFFMPWVFLVKTQEEVRAYFGITGSR
jgi:O-antigen/teichoic acid export membrane protein